MEILNIKRGKNSIAGGLKVYGSVLGDHGKTYRFGYIRRPNFRGWICNCENFLLSKFAKHRNCKHIKLVRGTYGRYGALVQKS